MPYLGLAPTTGENNSFRILDDISSYTLTFDGSSSSVVSNSDETITENNHRFVQGQRVTYTNGGGANIGGLTTGSVYYIIRDDKNTIKLAETSTKAAALDAINLTVAASGSSHTLTVAFDGFNTKFKATYGDGTIVNMTRAAQLVISINGVLQQPHDTSSPSSGFGYEIPSVIVLSTAPQAAFEFWGNIIASNNPTYDIADNKVDTFVGNGSATEFTLSKNSVNNENLIVTLDGVIQYPTIGNTTRAYNTQDNVLTFTTAPGNGVDIQVRHIGFAGNVAGGGGGVTGFYGRTGNVSLLKTDLQNQDITLRNLTGVAATFTGNVSVGGTLTYQDVTNIDSVGIITANTDIHVAGNIAHLGDTDTKVGFETNRINFEAHNSNRMYISQYGIFVQAGLGLGFLAATGPSPNIKSGGTDNQDLLLTTGTDNPTRIQITSAGKLQVKGTRGGNLQPEDDDTLQLYTKSTDNSINRGSGITFYNHDGSGYEMGGTIQVAKVNGTADNEASYMRFSTRAAGSATSERARIDSDGRLLIGIDASTSNDSQIQSYKPAGNNSTITVGNIATSSSGLCRYDFCPSNSTVGARIECHATEDFSEVAKRTADLVFITRKDGVNSQKLKISSNGAVGIGTGDFTPSKKLHLLLDSVGDGIHIANKENLYNAASTGYSDLRYTFYDYQTGGSTAGGEIIVRGRSRNAYATSRTTDLDLMVSPPGGTGVAVEAVRVQSDAKLGIGMNSDQKTGLKGKLDIDGSVQYLTSSTVGVNTSSNYAIVIRNPSTTGTANGIAWTNDSGANVGGAIVHIDQGSNNLGDLAFYTAAASNTPLERLRITKDGNVTTTGDTAFDRGDAGFTARKGDSVSITRDNGTPLEITRTSAQGNMINFFDTDATTQRAFIGLTQNDLIFGVPGSTEDVRINTSGELLVNHGASVGSGKIQAYASNQDGVDILSYSTTNTHGGRLTFYRSKNATVGTNSEVADGDSLGRIDWRGYNHDGTAYNQGARIEAFVSGDVDSTTDMPTDLVFKTSANGSATPAEHLRITSTGDILIGTTVDRPIAGQKHNSGAGWSGGIQIERPNPGALNNSGNPWLALTAWNGANESYTGGISFNRSASNTQGTHAAVNASKQLGNIAFNGSDGTNFIQGAEIFAIPEEAFATNDGPTALVFGTTPNGTSEDEPQERLRITSGGNIEVSTTTDTSAHYIKINANRSNNGDHLGGVHGVWNGNTVGAINILAGADTSNKDDGHLQFITYAGGSAYERLRIASGGNVGIGTDNPTQPLTLARTSAGQSEFGVRYQFVDTNGPTQTSAALLVNTRGLKFKNYNSSRHFHFETGNIGIGTDIPAKSLHVSSSTPAIRLTDTDTEGPLHCDIESVSGDLYLDTGSVHRDVVVSSVGRTNDNIARFTGDGKVGIGTDNPINTLHLNGKTSGVGPILQMSNNTGDCRIFFGTHSTTADANAQGQIRYNVANNEFKVYTSGTERLRITSDGLLQEGRRYSGSSTVDTGIYVGNQNNYGAAVFQVIVAGNPNHWGSGSYSACSTYILSFGCGWTGSATSTRFRADRISYGDGGSNNTSEVTATFHLWDATTSTETSSGTAVNGNNQLRIKIVGSSTASYCKCYIKLLSSHHYLN